jgi:hypothetical protein
MSRKTFALIVTLTLSTAVFGQLPDPIKGSQLASADERVATTLPNSAAQFGPESTDVCTFQFTSGGTATKQYLQYCVTVNGNIVEIQSPSGVEHIKHGIIGEGYAVCDFFSGLGYHDYAALGDGDTGSWGPPATVSHTGTMVKISRKTTDGIWTLTQTIAQSPADSSAKVTMALKNNTSVSRFVWFARVADVDANDSTNNILDGTFNTAFGYTASAQKGLQLSLATANSYDHVGYATQLASKACSINAGYKGLLLDADGVIYLNHAITIGAGKTATVALTNRGI